MLYSYIYEHFSLKLLTKQTNKKMDFTLGVITGVYAVIAVIVFYVVYIIEVKLDLPAIANGHHSTNYQNHNGDIPASTHSLTNHNNNTRHINNNEFANISEARLRQLIESIIAETLRMSSFATTSGAVSEIALDTRNPNDSLSNGTVGRRRHRTEHYFEPKIYQDLLATAVLNKIVDKHGNTRPISESTPDLSAHHIIDANFNVENQSTTSGSSLEPRSDCSYTDTEPIPNVNKGEDISPCDSDQNLNVDNKTAAVLAAGRESALSDYIAGHMVPLPDLSAPPTESEEDGTSSTVGEGTWEDNWLFKKRRQSLKTSVAPGSIGMLVPAPKEDIRAQIGDKVADEVSDLSEIGSDTDDSSLDLLHSNMDPLNDRLLNKHLIGGQNTKIVLDELIDGASMISNTTPTENEPTYTETKNIHVVDTGIAKTEAINENVTPLQEVLNTGIISPPAIFKDLDAEKSKPLSGSIAEREYKKWYNAVDMPNNPYAPDALKRRISGSQERFIDLPNISPTTEQNPINLIKDAEEEVSAAEQNREIDYKRYSRDYYINDMQQTTSPKRQSGGNISDEPATDNITINEVIPNGRNSSSANNSKSKTHSDCHWTLSTPVRRSSSLKFINNRSSQNSHSLTCLKSPPPLPHYNNRTQQLPPPRSYTSASHYDDNNNSYSQYKKSNANCDGDGDDNDDFDDIRSQRSWKSASAYQTSTLPTMPKRHTLSSLSFNSSTSGMSLHSYPTRKRTVPNANVLTQFEKQLLHKDLKRNSFRAISASTKDFVMNPLFDREQFFNANAGNKLKLSIKPDADEQGDSGVDSCLNGFSEIDVKNSNNSLLF